MASRAIYRSVDGHGFMMDTGARERILAAAEGRARAAGYNGFSFRDLAAEVGIKSSSVHYHFATKGDLCAALAHRYTEQTRIRLGDGRSLSAAEAVARVVDLFRVALLARDRMCLCGLLAAERDILPLPVEQAVAGFFRMLLEFFRDAFGTDWRGSSPATVVAGLEGGLILSRIMRDNGIFEEISAGLAQGLA